MHARPNVVTFPSRRLVRERAQARRLRLYRNLGMVGSSGLILLMITGVARYLLGGVL